MRLIDAEKLPRHKQLEAQGNGEYEEIEVVYGVDVDNAETVHLLSKEEYLQVLNEISKQLEREIMDGDRFFKLKEE